MANSEESRKSNQKVGERMKPYVDILGTRYKIEVRKQEEDEFLREKGLDGYCSEWDKLIVISDMTGKSFGELNDREKEVLKKITLRHELLHAFYNESGLSGSSNQFGGAWAKNEEMVDWFAIQFPKILEAYKWCECI